MVTALGGEEMAYKIAGGTKWWQVRAGPGVEAEWVVLKKDWKDYQKAKDRGAQKEKEKETKGKETKGKEKEKEKEKEREASTSAEQDDQAGDADSGECT
jgi:hypothetical protein